jgi:hexosaminidase
LTQDTTSRAAASEKPPAGPQPAPPPGPWAPRIWPLPQRFSNGSTTLTVVKPAASGSFFKMFGAVPKTLSAAFERYEHLAMPHPAAQASDANGVTSLSVMVDSMSEEHPQLSTNESYSLTIGSTGSARLHAATIYGVLHGLETFSQLVFFDFDKQQHTLPLAPWVIHDEPRFPHRGLMIDTSRHFETVATIKRMVDSLSYAKLNTLHWHMSDSQSFPFESKTHPKLWDGSWSKQERYTQIDVADVVEYARLRGVRVMVEL